jgi:hypothetical protein
VIAAAATLSWFAVLGLSGATPDTAPNVTYIATGTFSSPAVSGEDTLKLAGEPFTIDIIANAASVPHTAWPELFTRRSPRITTLSRLGSPSK